ncbi:Uma2 family endonuclease [Saccharothrix mutabilis subsp. mutabilis]|uniref:Uma2 family endonuclease n=1 Tax=Saccharothrix mutabilis subsp. mutabilis TaxID=66855 RepID=A0ABN0TCB6_9PSEU
MTAVPEETPRPKLAVVPHLLTVAEYAELGEVESGYTELQEGRLLMVPSPAPRHNLASLELAIRLRGQLSDDLVVIQDVDVDLELAPPGAPGFSRRPDVLVVRRPALKRVEEEGGLIRASEVEVVIEIVSPGSYRTDHVIKREEYAAAGIPRYWIVDLAEPISLVDCQLAGEFGYQQAPDVVGKFETTAPCAIVLRIDDLV